MAKKNIGKILRSISGEMLDKEKRIAKGIGQAAADTTFSFVNGQPITNTPTGVNLYKKVHKGKAPEQKGMITKKLWWQK